MGDLLLELGRPREALEAYESSLRAWPGRFHSLLGAARASQQAGEAARAREHYAALLESVGRARTDRPGRWEARTALTDR